MSSKILRQILPAIFLAVAFSACQKSPPITVPPLQDYRDGSNFFAIKIPADWQQSSEPGKLNIYNTQDAWNRFADPTSSSKSAVRIYIHAEDVGAQKLDDVVEKFKDDLRQQQAQIDPDVQTVLAGNPAVKVPYSLKIDSKNAIYAYCVLTVADSVEYGFECQGFNEDFKRYAPIFDTVQATYRIIPKAVAAQQLPEDLIPSPAFATYQNDVFAIQYPDNFKVSTKAASGDIKSSISIMGYFQDCTIEVDVLDAKKLSVDKVFDQNKGNYPNSKSEKTKLDGLDAYMISYSPVAGIQRRVYFVVKNNNWIRVILTWNEVNQKKYGADFDRAFEKAATSIVLK